MSWLVIFRSESIGEVFEYIGRLSHFGEFKHGEYLLFPITLLLIEWPLRKDERLEKLSLGWVEIPILGLFMALIFMFRETTSDFIYFQF
tara:strand:- start:4930 stop:5196 length:267 start_codon:yes stop_codon:yes gene_type:complete